MSDGMGREPAYLSSHATNRYFIPNWGIDLHLALGDKFSKNMQLPAVTKELSTKIGRNIRPSANK